MIAVDTPKYDLHEHLIVIICIVFVCCCCRCCCCCCCRLTNNRLSFAILQILTNVRKEQTNATTSGPHARTSTVRTIVRVIRATRDPDSVVNVQVRKKLALIVLMQGDFNRSVVFELIDIMQLI